MSLAFQCYPFSSPGWISFLTTNLKYNGFNSIQYPPLFDSSGLIFYHSQKTLNTLDPVKDNQSLSKYLNE